MKTKLVDNNKCEGTFSRLLSELYPKKLQSEMSIDTLLYFRFQMLMSNIGRIKYPTFTVLRHTNIYHERKDLLKSVKMR